MEIDVRERLRSGPSEELVSLVFEPAIRRDFEMGFQHLIDINKAHVIMLCKQNLLLRDDASAILGALEKLESGAYSLEDLNFAAEDLHFNVETRVIQLVGAEIGGRMHMGRSRNDLHATMDRMMARVGILEVMDLLAELIDTATGLAGEHVDTVMTGYTHTQPAQPVSLGYYLSGVVEALKRDSARLEAAYSNINRCPLGAGAMAGTGFPIDRSLVSELLGFDMPTSNSLDAVASRDWVSETLAALSILMSNISRLSHDLYIWSTDEFSYVEVADSLAAVSSIMPQKKNPIALEHCKAKAGHVFGALVANLSCTKNTPFGHCRDISAESVTPLWSGLEETCAALRLITESIRTLTVNKDVMSGRARDNFSTATELADSLVRQFDMPFRIAHMIVAKVVSNAVGAGIRSDHITPEMVDEAAVSVIGRPLGLSREMLKQVMDPDLNMRIRSSLGGPAPTEVRAMLADDSRHLDEYRARTCARKKGLFDAGKRLDSEVSVLSM